MPQNHAICIQWHLLSTDFWHSYGFARLCCLCQHGNGRRVTKGLSHFTLATSPVKPSNDCDNEYIGQTKCQCGAKNIKKLFSFSKKKIQLYRKTHAQPTIQLGGISLKLSPPIGVTTSAFVWKLIKSANAPLNRDDGGLLPDAYLHLVRKRAVN